MHDQVATLQRRAPPQGVTVTDVSGSLRGDCCVNVYPLPSPVVPAFRKAWPLVCTNSILGLTLLVPFWVRTWRGSGVGRTWVSQRDSSSRICTLRELVAGCTASHKCILFSRSIAVGDEKELPTLIRTSKTLSE